MMTRLWFVGGPWHGKQADVRSSVADLLVSDDPPNVMATWEAPQPAAVFRYRLVEFSLGDGVFRRFMAPAGWSNDEAWQELVAFALSRLLAGDDDAALPVKLRNSEGVVVARMSPEGYEQLRQWITDQVARGALVEGGTSG